MTRPHIILFIEGGVLHEVLSNVPIDYTLIDMDTDGIEEEKLMPIASCGEAYVTVNQATVQPDSVRELSLEIERNNADKEAA